MGVTRGIRRKQNMVQIDTKAMFVVEYFFGCSLKPPLDNKDNANGDEPSNATFLIISSVLVRCSFQ